MPGIIRTLKVRIKDKHAAVLREMARQVNTVWNYCNETSYRAIRERRKFLSGYDLQKLTDGFSKCDGVRVGSATIQQVCEEYATRRRQCKKSRLNWRVSNPKSSRKSLGWIPFKSRALTYKAGQVRFCSIALNVWDSYGLSGYTFRSGSFSEDSRGRWYLNVQVQIPELCGPSLPAPALVVGVDLGLTTAATCSDGAKIKSGIYRRYETKLGLAQRANKKKRVRAIHAKICNTRKHVMHRFSRELINRSGAIFVGNVSSQAMVKTKLAKSTLDAGWSMLKTMLEYKSHQAGIVFEVVNESYTTQTCSGCGVIPASSPKGRAGLGIRRWTCSNCGSVHDRDINAARNIAALGLQRLAGGIQASTQ